MASSWGVTMNSISERPRLPLAGAYLDVHCRSAPAQERRSAFGCPSAGFHLSEVLHLSALARSDVLNPPRAHGGPRQCTWCLGCLISECHALPKRSVAKNCVAVGTAADLASKSAPQGVLTARYARFDWMCAFARLSQRIARWVETCDKAI